MPNQSALAEVIAFPEPITRVERPTLRPTSRGKIVGRNPAMQRILETIGRVASTTCTVLVTGESGTGKELVVAALHDASPRASRPLITVNCGAIPENLIESELFGHARGAFTGANAARQGFVAAAQGGTLFLDEVGELPLAVQVKLLRLIQQRQYSVVGDSRVCDADIRIVAATNRDLEVEVAARRFREDLYYRLNVIHIHLPALRDRADDIEPLATSFLESCAERCGRTDVRGFTPGAMALLKAYDWPGNVRSLENTVERAILLAPGTLVTESDLPARIRAGEPASGVTRTAEPLPEGGVDLRAAVQNFENNLIRQALEKTGRNKNQAARLLGLNRTTLVEMLKRKAI
jgi:DNA-binding NtrC family response regulator